MMQAELVFIPLPAAGHLASTVQLAKLLVSREKNLSIRILLFKDNNGNSCIPSLHMETSNTIQFVEVPESTSQANLSGKPENHFFFLCKLVESHKPQVRDMVAQLKESASSKLVGFVVDMFTLEMIDVANEFEVPSYLFYTSGAATLGLWGFVQSLIDECNIDITGYEDSETEFLVPTYINPVPAKLFPSPLFYKESLAICIKLSKKMTETRGIMINSFLDVESYALEALAGDPKMPPVFPVGPLINFTGIHTNYQGTEILMEWLDAQPTSSIVFLCFGSSGFFDGDQVKEIANAIEHSGCRFLWSLRRAPSKDHPEHQSDYEFHEEVLPKGFLQRTAGVGKIIGWAPQVQVLAHPAVGGFVTHCGWNSVLESIWFGIPMAVWPLYAEQQVNSFFLAKDLGIAVEIKMDYNTDPISTRVVVKANEIENGIRQLMQPESEKKKKVEELMVKSRNAMEEGGSSYISLGSFLGHFHGVH